MKQVIFYDKDGNVVEDIVSTGKMNQKIIRMRAIMKYVLEYDSNIKGPVLHDLLISYADTKKDADRLQETRVLFRNTEEVHDFMKTIDIPGVASVEFVDIDRGVPEGPVPKYDSVWINVPFFGLNRENRTKVVMFVYTCVAVQFPTNVQQMELIIRERVPGVELQQVFDYLVAMQFIAPYKPDEVPRTILVADQTCEVIFKAFEQAKGGFGDIDAVRVPGAGYRMLKQGLRGVLDAILTSKEVDEYGWVHLSRVKHINEDPSENLTDSRVTGLVLLDILKRDSFGNVKPCDEELLEMETKLMNKETEVLRMKAKSIEQETEALNNETALLKKKTEELNRKRDFLEKKTLEFKLKLESEKRVKLGDEPDEEPDEEPSE